MQIFWGKPDSTKQNEKFDYTVKVLNPFNEVWFGDMKTDLTVGHWTSRNKNLIFGLNSAL